MRIQWTIGMLVAGSFLGMGSPASAQLSSPTPSTYQLNLTTFATHGEFQSGGGSNPSGTASAYGAIDVSAPKDGSGRVFVSSQTGKILSYGADGSSLGTLVDLNSTSIRNATGFVRGEGASAFQGLMYFDFHPDFNNAGTAGHQKVYAGYQVRRDFDSNGATLPTNQRVGSIGGRENGNQYAIGEFTVSSSNPNQVDPNSFREVYRVQMEAGNVHGLGQISFNPNSKSGDADYGLLYANIGDASRAGNSAPNGNYLQSLSNPFGKKIRINPLQDGPNSYSVPSDNPFVGNANATPEIYAAGFRDAQSFSFAKDKNGEDVLVSFEIGALNREEINLVRPGGNYGWQRFEGSSVYNNSISLAPGTTHSGPALEIDHSDRVFAIVGGMRVTDPNDPNFVDQVLFSDLPTGKMFFTDYEELLSFEDGSMLTAPSLFEINAFTKDGIVILERAGDSRDGLTFEDVVNRTRGDVRFGTDETGNVYLVTKQSGEIFRTGLIAVSSVPEPGSALLLCAIAVFSGTRRRRR